MTDYIRGFIYPFSNKDNILRTIVAAVVSLGWFFAIPLFFLQGYIVSVIRKHLNDEEEMTSWKEFLSFQGFVQIVTDGVMFTVIMAAYILPAIAFMYLATLTGPGSAQLMTQFESGVAVPQLSFATMSLSIISVVLLFFGLFLIPYAIIIYASESSIVSALNYANTIRHVVANLKDYTITSIIYCIFAVLGIVLMAVLNVLSGIVITLLLLYGAYVYPRSFTQ